MRRPGDEVGPVPAGRDPDEYDRLRRRVLWAMPTGLFVVGSRAGGRANLMTANWVMQIATSPKLVALSVESTALTRRLVEEGGGFSVSVLAREDRALVRKFVKPVEAATRDGDGVLISMRGEPVHEVAGGLPCLSDAIGWFACAVREICTWDGGAGAAGGASHVLCVGEVVDAGLGAGAGDGGDVEDGPARAVLRMEDTRMSYGG